MLLVVAHHERGAVLVVRLSGGFEGGIGTNNWKCAPHSRHVTGIDERRHERTFGPAPGRRPQALDLVPLSGRAPGQIQKAIGPCLHRLPAGSEARDGARQRGGIARQPKRAPSTAPATAPLVSVSPPALTTATIASSKSGARRAHHRATCIAFRVQLRPRHAADRPRHAHRPRRTNE